MSQLYYKIRIQQGDVAFEVEATNPEFASAQLNKLAEEVLGIKPVTAALPPSQTITVSEQPIAVDAPLPETPIEMPLPVIEPSPTIIEASQAVLAEPVVAEIEHETPLPAEEDPQFEAFMDTLLSDLDNPASEIKLPFETPAPEPSPPPISENIETTQPEKPGLASLNLGALKEKKVESFDSVFTEAQLQLNVTEAANAEPSSDTDSGALFQSKEHNITSIETLQELCEMASNAQSAEDFLLLTGYFLHQYKATPRFSLKALNTELVRTGLTPINHAILENTVTIQLLSMVPDLTGDAQTTEYELTPDGTAYVQELLGIT